ncbi:MAG: 1-deoxy-D-xylulose-5-phosphate synthase [Peptococcaceae bacterium]|nr:1-deoxy-D-xylulose-5-phosphate synthase [Peptococcaceae bacterium]
MLENIQSRDIKNLSMDQLRALAKEIRRRLIEVCAKNGGHLAPNLGIVEITLALHYVYDFPKDKLVWDVGHQVYVHKLLTGRNARFDTLRQYEGISGFPKRSESSYDDFGAGHASTSLSAATGFAAARDLFHEDNNVIAVIGDGAMTGGMAFEAMNYAAHLQTKMTIVLNDNEMSIGPNVGGMSQYLTRMRTDPGYNRFKEDMELFLKRIPNIGPKMAEMADHLKDSVKYMLVSGNFFEELGLRYYGPVNGHDIEELIRVFENSKQFDCPVLIHCLTEKGKGYLPAERHPDKFHGVGAFDIKTGETLDKSTQPSYTKVFSQTLVDLARDDRRIVGITAAMASGTGMDAFHKAYPKRAFDVGIAEEHAATMASAMALEGLKPVVAIYSTFMQRAYDQMIHDCALQEAPVVFALDRAGIVGADGPTHHGVFDLSYLRTIPGMTVMAPKDEAELQNMLYSALKYDRLVAIRYPRGRGPGAALVDSYTLLPYGEAEVLREGKDATIVAIGAMVTPALTTAALLEENGFSVGVINARFAKPLDKERILNAAKTSGPLITMEENILAGGFGSAVLEAVSDAGLCTPVLRIGLPDAFVAHGDTNRLKEDEGLTPDKMAARIQAFLNER